MKFLYIYSDPPTQPHPVVVEHSDSNPLSFQRYCGEPNALDCTKEMILLLRQLQIGGYCNDNKTRGLWVRVE